MSYPGTFVAAVLQKLESAYSHYKGISPIKSRVGLNEAPCGRIRDMSKKLIIAVITIVVIGVAAVYIAYDTGYERAVEKTPTQDTTLASEMIEEQPADTLTWIKADLPSNYKHPQEIWYPAGWFFNCCGDKNTESNHLVVPNKEIAPNEQPHIVVTDYALVGCLPTNPSCGIDELVGLTPEQRFKSLQKTINETGMLSGKTELTNTGQFFLNGLGTTAEVYQGITSYNETSLEFYLASTDVGVLGLTFYRPEQLGEELIKEFLHRLK